MSEKQTEQVLVKDDRDLFSLVRQLTTEEAPIEMWEQARQSESLVQVELPFSVLLATADQLPLDRARVLHQHLEERLATAARSG